MGEQPQRDHHGDVRRRVADQLDAELAVDLPGKITQRAPLEIGQHARRGAALALLECGDGVEGAAAELAVDQVLIMPQEDQIGLGRGALVVAQPVEPDLRIIE
jgi:hypothetical protein